MSQAIGSVRYSFARDVLVEESFIEEINNRNI
jgi:hypothetical protein